MKRALTETAKIEKYNLILETARSLFETSSYKELKMADIAAASHLSKGTIFNYFPTKEELFIALLLTAYIDWFNAVDNRLLKESSLSGHAFNDMFLELIDESLHKNTLLYRLILIQNTLESNISEETALILKQVLFERVNKSGHLISETTPELEVEDGIQIMMTLSALFIGFSQMSDMPELIKRTVEDQNFGIFKINAANSIKQGMHHYIKGLLRPTK